jgi:NADP-dependent 3-hydroxy acid dehydrogenase YdfG
MRKQKSGRIAYGGNTPYHAAKCAVGGFSDALAMEVAPFGVKVSSSTLAESRQILLSERSIGTITRF